MTTIRKWYINRSKRKGGFSIKKYLFAVFLLFIVPSLLSAQQGGAKTALPSWIITRYDPNTGITWYQPGPRYSEYENTFALLVGRRKTGKPWLLLRIAFTYGWDRDILLIYKYSIRTEKKSYVIRTSFNSVNRSINHIKHNYSEWYDNYVYPELYSIIKEVITSESAVIGFHGINGYAERIISKTEKERLEAMLEVYEQFGGDYRFQ
ncbi:MAG: hypothetical protein P8107_03020 [Spirochaetia bacterium]